MAGRVGLGAQSEAVRRLARHSVRLQPLPHAARPDSAAGCWVGGVPPPAHARRARRFGRAAGAEEASVNIDWPLHHGSPLPCIAQIDLGELATLLPCSPLPAVGYLAFFFDVARPQSQMALVERSAAAVRHLRRPLSASPEHRHLLAGALARPAAELCLPRAYSPLLSAWGLDAAQLAAWQRLRDDLAGDQGLPSPEAMPQPSEINRLLGFPDERNTPMALLCELAEQGLDVSYGLPLPDAGLAAAEERSLRWRLLLELSAGAGSVLSRHGAAGYERVYYWIDEQSLRAGEFLGACAIAV